ncbi:hypothetical protein Nepgr_001978 [Nepenthes gracilis]|uniref:PUM-HD domain-containing protein n=1 Tax=Nepenthes gracilis TaxID=150966 RepID=A0AAD3RXH1_NEPGR|nr:hypothetical protein Nepgr_001978 [Nepenthes gracilis]
MFREKKIIENMKTDSDREVQKFLNEFPNLTSNHPRRMLESPSNVGSSSYTSGLSFPHDGSSSLSPFDVSKQPTASTQHRDRLLMDSSASDHWYISNNDDCMLDDLGLIGEFQNLHIADGNEVCPSVKQFRMDPDGFRTFDRKVATVKPICGEKYRSFEGLTTEYSRNGGFPPSPLHRFKIGFDEEMKFGWEPRGCKIGDSMESYFAQNQSNVPLFSGPSYYNYVMNYPFGDMTHPGNDCYGSGIPVQNPCFPFHGDDHNSLKHCKVDLIGNREDLNSQVYSQNMSFCKPYSNESLLRQSGLNSSGNMGLLNSPTCSQLIHPDQGFRMENVAPNPPSLKERMRAVVNSGVPQSVVLMKSPRKLNAYGCEDTLIVQENSLNDATGKYDILRGRTRNCWGGSMIKNLREMKMELNGKLQPEGNGENGRNSLGYHQTLFQPANESLVEVRSNICSMAKDQHGCRFLQKNFDEGSHEDRQIIFNEIIDHIVELMTNPFGNYLIQKLLIACNEDQRTSIVHMVTREPGELVRISLNTHGTRVVQKLIETLKTRRQMSLVMLALEPGFLDLMRDLNGNHVVQRCLHCFSSEDNKLIFDAAAKFCVKIATHQHGCCFLQRCIDHSDGEHRQKLIAGICANGLLLAQDPYGNYVVQYIIELKIASASASLISQFERHYVHLSMQKFSSHVVEKCLKFCEESQPRIVHELLSVSYFEQLLQDPYANYVIQSALEATKGPLHDSLVAAVRPHTVLRSNPYCKKIFARGLLKK